MKNKSFTLIELLVVIVIIGILAGVIIVSVSSSIEKANFAKAKAFSSTVQSELFSNLISEWTFDEDSGTTTKDTGGNNDGTVSGAIYTPRSSNECVFGSCYSFDGNDYIGFGTSSSLQPKTSITISLWAYRSGVQNLLFSFGADGGIGASGYQLRMNKFRIYKALGESGACNSPTGKDYINQWTYIVGIYDGLIIRLYQNGKEIENGLACVGEIIYNSSFSETVIGSLGYIPPTYNPFSGFVILF